MTESPRADDAYTPTGPPEGSAISRVARIFYTPREVFEELRRSPSWIWALVVLVAASLGSQLVVMPRLDYERTIRQQVAERGGGQELTDEQIESQVEMVRKFSTSR